MTVIKQNNNIPMKTIRLFTLLFVCMMLVQCNTVERRQSKAEDLIKKHLFENLDEFDSITFVSISLDTLKDVWMSNPEMQKLGEDYYYAQRNNSQVNYQIQNIEDEMNSIQQTAIGSLYSRNYGAFFNKSAKYDQLKKNLKEVQTVAEEAFKSQTALEDSLRVRNQKLNTDNPGWYVTYKYRCPDSNNKPRIHTKYFILNPDITSIIYSWDEDDYEVKSMIESVNDALKSIDRKPENTNSTETEDDEYAEYYQ